MLAAVEILAAGGIVASASLLVAYYVSIVRELSEARRETSRFPLFAARTSLIGLVADGSMNENDQAWRNIYTNVNLLLRMDQNLNLLDFVFRYVNVKAREERDAGFRAKLQNMSKLEAEAIRRAPAFGKTIAEVDSAILCLVRRRTTTGHRAILSMFMFGLKILSLTFSLGIKTALAVSRSFFSPSKDDARTWRTFSLA